MRVPPISMLHSILFDEEQCLMFLFHHGAFYTSRECESCHIPMINYQPKKHSNVPRSTAARRYPSKQTASFLTVGCPAHRFSIWHISGSRRHRCRPHKITLDTQSRQYATTSSTSESWFRAFPCKRNE